MGGMESFLEELLPVKLVCMEEPIMLLDEGKK